MMVSYLIVSRSLTSAQKTARALERAGITAIIAGLPRGISAEGGAYGVRISENSLADALVAMEREGIVKGRICVLREGCENLHQ